MTVEFSKVCRDFLALIGESPDLLPILPEGETAPVLTLSEALKVRIREAAIRATLETPPLFLDEVKSLSIRPVEGEYGILTIRMPDDYLKFHSLKMADWKESLQTIESVDSLRRALGAVAPSWMICRERPMVVEERDADGIFLKIYGSESQAIPPRMLYVPIPAFDGETLTISSGAYSGMLAILVNDYPH